MSKREEHRKIRAKVLRADLKVDYVSSTRREIEAVREAIYPETRNQRKCKLRSSVNEKNGLHHLVLNFDSSDLTSLRASLNTNLRLLSSSIKAMKTTAQARGD